MIDWYTDDNVVDYIGDIPIVKDNLYAVHRYPLNPLDPEEKYFPCFMQLEHAQLEGKGQKLTIWFFDGKAKRKLIVIIKTIK